MNLELLLKIIPIIISFFSLIFAILNYKKTWQKQEKKPVAKEQQTIIIIIIIIK